MDTDRSGKDRQSDKGRGKADRKVSSDSASAGARKPARGGPQAGGADKPPPARRSKPGRPTRPSSSDEAARGEASSEISPANYPEPEPPPDRVWDDRAG